MIIKWRTGSETAKMANAAKNNLVQQPTSKRGLYFHGQI